MKPADFVASKFALLY